VSGDLVRVASMVNRVTEGRVCVGDVVVEIAACAQRSKTGLTINAALFLTQTTSSRPCGSPRTVVYNGGTTGGTRKMVLDCGAGTKFSESDNGSGTRVSLYDRCGLERAYASSAHSRWSVTRARDSAAAGPDHQKLGHPVRPYQAHNPQRLVRSVLCRHIWKTVILRMFERLYYRCHSLASN
jgi:hypothetical protein